MSFSTRRRARSIDMFENGCRDSVGGISVALEVGMKVERTSARRGDAERVAKCREQYDNVGAHVK